MPTLGQCRQVCELRPADQVTLPQNAQRVLEDRFMEKEFNLQLEAHYTSTSMEYWCRMMFLLLIKSPEMFLTTVTLTTGVIIWTHTLLKQFAILWCFTVHVCS